MILLSNVNKPGLLGFIFFTILQGNINRWRIYTITLDARRKVKYDLFNILQTNIL